MLIFHFSPKWKLTALLSLCYISSESSEIKLALVNQRVLPPLLALLNSSITVLVSLAVSTLRNIASGGSNLRDRLLAEGIIAPLNNLIQPDTPVNLNKFYTSQTDRSILSDQLISSLFLIRI